MTFDPPTPQNGLPADRDPNHLPLWVVFLMVAVVGGAATFLQFRIL